MLRIRVIPCLLLLDAGLVKTIQFSDPKYIGDPINAVKIFNDKEVDELVFLDIGASKRNSGPNYSLIESIASECFMPVCYGGGISSVEQARRIINLGIEKIAVNNAVLSGGDLVTRLAGVLGSQSVVIGIDVKKDWLGRYRVFDAVAGKTTNISPEEYAANMQKAGAGEIFLNNVDCDGMQQGYDTKLVAQVAGSVDIPVIACGGAGNTQNFVDAVKAGAAAVGAGSLFVFQGKHRAVLISYPSYDELEKMFGKE